MGVLSSEWKGASIRSYFNRSIAVEAAIHICGEVGARRVISHEWDRLDACGWRFQLWSRRTGRENLIQAAERVATWVGMGTLDGGSNERGDL